MCVYVCVTDPQGTHSLSFLTQCSVWTTESYSHHTVTPPDPSAMGLNSMYDRLQENILGSVLVCPFNFQSDVRIKISSISVLAIQRLFRMCVVAQRTSRGKQLPSNKSKTAVYAQSM